MPELGDKHTCADCETKYYDLGRSDATCPKCGSANRVEEDEIAAAPPRAPRAQPKPKPVAAEDDAADDGKGEGGEEGDNGKSDEELDLDEKDGENGNDEEA